MRPIVCATRGGEACRRTQERAIELAKEHNARLIFLYVADPSLVGPVDELLVEPLKAEMGRLGRSLLRIAQGRAKRAGKTAEMAVVHGSVQPSIIEFLRQQDAGVLVLGAPRSGATPQEFSNESIDQFALVVQQEANIEVVVVT